MKETLRPNIFRQILNVPQTLPFYEMRELYRLNEKSSPLNAVWAKELVINLRRDLGPFFGIVQKMSVRDLARKGK